MRGGSAVSSLQTELFLRQLQTQNLNAESAEDAETMGIFSARSATSAFKNV